MEKVIKKINGYYNGNVSINKNEIINILLIFVGFFLGRVWIFDSFNPIIISYLSLFLFRNYRFSIIAFFSCLGIISSSVGQITYLYIVSIGILILANYLIKSSRSTFLQGSIGTFSLVISSITVSYFVGFNYYYVMLTVLEGIFIIPLTFVLKKGMNILEGNVNRDFLSGEEIISLAIILACIVAGASGIYIWKVSLRDVLSSVIVLVIGYKGGVTFGGLSGMLLGLILLFTGYADKDMAIILSVSGICSGIYYNKNKFITIILFTIGRLLTTFFLNTAGINMDLIISLLVSDLVFLVIKDSFFYDFSSTVNQVVSADDEYISKVKEITTNRLDDFSRAFHRLSLTFDSLTQIKTSLNQDDVNEIIEEITSKVCDKCELNHNCWKDNFLLTYQSVFKMMTAFEDKGKIEVSDIQENFLNKCINLTEFVDVTTRVFEIHKLNLIWENRVSESRELVSLQLLGVSEIINDLSKRINKEIIFEDELEEKLLNGLLASNLPIDNMIVIKNSYERYEVTIALNKYVDKKNCNNLILPVLKKVLKKEMRKDDRNSTDTKFMFIEEPKFKVSSSVAKTIKDNSEASGDSYSYMEMDTGEILLALSDGMGSGYEAMLESNATIDLLEEFIEAGFDKELAINIINSALVLKSNDESFSTLDICTIDIYNGNAEFIKIGASSTFLLRDGKVQIIKSTSLPMGIFNTVDAEISLKKLKDDDVIIMATDGVLEIFDNTFYKEEWIVNYLENIDSTNPEHIARKLLDEAKERSNDVISDDMTILVAKVWEGV